ncbi:MAG: AsmA protein [Pseudomonadota bacterium]|nr:AsmA protein [Pseudomonadota bacterium]
MKLNLPKIIKISIMIIAVLIITAGIGLTAMVTLINPNIYKPLIAKAVEDNTGRKLNLSGNISWKLWPNIGLHIESVSLSNPQEFKFSNNQNSNLISIQAAYLSVQLLPLLNHSIVIDSLDITGMNLVLLKNGDTNNWTFDSKNEISSTESTPAKPLHFSLKHLAINNSTISYNDLKTKFRRTIANFDFMLKANHKGIISMDQEHKVVVLKNVEFNFSDLISGETNLNFDGFSTSTYSGDINLNKFSLPKLLAKIDTPIKSVQNKSLFDSISFIGSFNGDKTNLKLDKANFIFSDNLKINLNAAISNISSDALKYHGYVNLPEFSLNEVLNGLGMEKTKPNNTNKLFDKFTLNTSFSGDKDNINLQHLVFDFPEAIKGTVNLKLNNFSNPSYTGNINLPTFSLNQVMQKYGAKPIDINHPEILNQVSFQSNFNGSSNSINLANILAKVSNSNINGNLDVKSITPLKLNQNINIDKIELSDIHDISGYKIPLNSIHSSGSLSMDSHKNMASLNAIQALTVANVTVLGFNLNNFIGQMDKAVTGTGKVISIDNLRHIDNSVQVIDTIKNMQLIIARAKAKGQKDYSQKTDLGNLIVNTTIKNGIATPATFKLSGPSIKSNGQGTVNLVNKSLNYTINTGVTLKERNTVLNNIIFPYSMSGQFDNINGSLDWISIQKQLIEYLIKNAGTNTKSLIKNQINSNVGSQIQNAPTAVKQGVSKVIDSIFK